MGSYRGFPPSPMVKTMMTPEDLLICMEEGEEPEYYSSFDSVPLSQLIEGGHQVRMHSEEDGEKENLFNPEEFEHEFGAAQGLDMEFDENDPPIETRCARWACPYGEQEIAITPVSQENQPKDPVTRALLLNEKIENMSQYELTHSYFGLGLTKFPGYLRRFLQKSVEMRLEGLRNAVKRWQMQQEDLAKREAKEPGDFEEGTAATKERADIALKLLDRILLKEDTPTREYNPIIHDQYFEIDRKFTRLEATRDDHINGEARDSRREEEDWFHKMWKPDGSKNMSGEEALYLARNRDEREWRVEAVMNWIQQTTSPAALKAGLSKLNTLYNQSRSECFKKKSWSEIRYREDQVKLLRNAFKKKIQEKANGKSPVPDQKQNQ